MVTDEGNQRLVIFAPNGSVTLRLDTTQFSDPQSYPLDVVVTPTGTIIYADFYIVTEVTSTGQFLRQFNTTAGGQPAVLALDTVYNRLFVGDIFAETIYLFSLNGSLLGTPVTPSESIFEAGIAYSPLQQTLYVAELEEAILTFPIQPPISGVLPTSSLCAIFYGLPGSVDYPFSIATSLTFQYLPTLVTNSLGTAVQLVSGSGVRTYTNRFGTSFSTPLTLAQTGTGATDNLLYLQSAVPVDSGGLVFTLASPVQLPGAGTFPAYSSLTFFNQSGYIGEGASGRLDTQGQVFLSSVPGFRNVTIAASNINALAPSYATCSVPLTFTNGLRAHSAEHRQLGAALPPGVLAVGWRVIPHHGQPHAHRSAAIRHHAGPAGHAVPDHQRNHWHARVHPPAQQQVDHCLRHTACLYHARREAAVAALLPLLAAGRGAGRVLTEHGAVPGGRGLGAVAQRHPAPAGRTARVRHAVQLHHAIRHAVADHVGAGAHQRLQRAGAGAADAGGDAAVVTVENRQFWLYEEWVRVTGVCKRERWRFQENECAFLLRVRVRVLSRLSRA